MPCPTSPTCRCRSTASAPGYSPLEAEQRITFPIETAMAGIPDVEYTRSLSRYGLSQVTVVFKDGTDIYWARQQVAERLAAGEGTTPAGDRITDGTDLDWPRRNLHVDGRCEARREEAGRLRLYTPTDLREIQDWVIKPQLRNVPGVVEVNSIGGFEKQYHVTPDPRKLVAYGLSFHDVMEALAKNNANVGAGYIERNGEQYLIRAPGQVRDMADIRGIVVASRKGLPVHIGDIAEVALGQRAAHRRGLAQRPRMRARHDLHAHG